MAYTTIDDPTIYFNTIAYTGDGRQDVTGVGFQPNWVWVKARGNTYNHQIHDSVRGATAGMLSSNSNDAENSTYQFDSFDSDGFTTDSGNVTGVNGNTHTQVAWNWKAGTSFSNDASATSVGTIDSTGSINVTAGISIISYTGTGSAGSIAHGLNSVPKVVLAKRRSDASNWCMYHESHGNTKALYLNNNTVGATSTTFWNDTTPTSSVFTVGSDAATNGSGDTQIAWCFTDVKGYSKFGSFSGTGSANGGFVHTGFAPAWLILKKTNSSGSVNWFMFDNKRSPINAVDDFLKADTSDAEGGDGNGYLDFLSNGFKFRTANIGTESGGTFIYMAFAESPFVNSNGVPNNAR